MVADAMTTILSQFLPVAADVDAMMPTPSRFLPETVAAVAVAAGMAVPPIPTDATAEAHGRQTDAAAIHGIPEAETTEITATPETEDAAAIVAVDAITKETEKKQKEDK